MNETMTITEGLKKLNRIEKRIIKNCDEIAKYSSLLSNEKPIFDTESKQREEIAKLIQANGDLELEYCRLKSRVDYTNMATYVQIDDDNRTIHDWLLVQRKTGSLMAKTFTSLSTQEAKLNQHRYIGKENTPTIIRLFDENEKRSGQRKWQDLIGGQIEGRLEVINATTELAMIPE
jgi:hypothetical protein